MVDLIPLVSEDEFYEFLGGIYGSPVAIDTETNAEDIRDGRGFLMGISLATADRVIYLPFRHVQGWNCPKEWIQPLQAALDNAKFVIFHNAKFDLVSLETLGIKINVPFYCTMLMAHWLDENLWSKSLEAVGQKYVGEGKDKPKEFKQLIKAIGWANIPSDYMGNYARQDAALPLKIFNCLYPRFKKEGYDGELWETEQRFIRLIIAMESTGIQIDTNLCEQESFYGESVMECIARALGFNPGSTKQLGDYLIGDLKLPVVKKTPTGRPCFDKDAMKIYDELLEGLENDSARLLLEYRGWQKAVSACYRSYLYLLGPDGRLRPNYKLHGTVTGRLSCEQPNLQQIPKVSSKPWNGAIKAAFIPREGYRLYEADYSQLELRLGASYAKESGLLAEFAQPDSDVFTRMSIALGMSRPDTKTLTYTLQYGGGINRIKDVFKVDEFRAAEIRGNYFNTYPGFKRITAVAAGKATSRGYVKTWSGRRRHFQYPKTESFKAFNSVIQGGAAEIVKRSMLRLHDTGCNVPECRMLLQVHDSVVFEIKEDKVAEFEPLIKKAMEEVEPDFGVRFAVDFHEWGK